MLIEQAIFTSARTSRADGYQLVAESPGVGEQDARELAAWGPSHDALLESGPDAVSINFHPLTSGAMCVSKTAPAGPEYSGRRGPQIYTQCMVAPAEVMSRFGNNPFALLTAAFAQGSLKMHGDIPERLEPFRLTGRATTVDQALLAQLLADPGPAWLGALINAALRAPSIALVAGSQRPRLLAGLFACLPPSVRPAFSFSTGLRYSPRRPFRISCVPDTPSEQRRLFRQYDVAVLELASNPPSEYAVQQGWAGFVSCALATGKVAHLAARIAEVDEALPLAELDAVGDEFSRRLTDDETENSGKGGDAAAAAGIAPTLEALPLEAVPLRRDALRRDDAPHARHASPDSPPDSPAKSLAQPSTGAATVDVQSPRTLELLEALDDAVYDAIAGQHEALRRVRILWPQVTAELGSAAVEESREHYVRRALEVWRECIEGEELRDPLLAAAALDVLSLLFEEPASLDS